MNAPARRFPVSALAACLLGLAICPLAFIAMGALAQFPPLFTALFLPPFLLGAGFLLWRYVSRSPDPPARRLPLLVLEGLGWIAVVVFLYFVSGFTLLTTAERVGLASTAFLTASVLCLPVVLLRRGTALERRLSPLPDAAAIALLLLVLVASAAATVSYLTTPAKFI